MPTLPSGAPGPAVPESRHDVPAPGGEQPTPTGSAQVRTVAESFGADADRYDRTRPPYPEALVAALIEASPGPDVLDVGCGTGIAARQFRAAGCRVHGVEPDARMAERARRSGLPVDVARFEDWDPDGRTFDAVVAGTAWHWIDPVAGARHAAHVLRPGGLLAPFWHAFQLPAPLAEAVAALCERLLPEAPFDTRAALTKPAAEASRAHLDRAADGIRNAGGFDEPQRLAFTWEMSCTKTAWLDQMPTLGLFTRLPPHLMAEARTEATTALDPLPDPFPIPYTTTALTTHRTAA
ncbi:class I SAM-dependent methyltransferase [Streptomyces sp. NRRL F-5053]|uniref:class I SAM-dependent methyltransferase n=1 Tax=Streptomyces sp. NRRL F-5053 TaxID=1463854 RepID=UPI0004C9225C|nr:class I SAM-dependent methyltransferase [Streptomyces sp. NRRL F-5053]